MTWWWFRLKLRFRRRNGEAAAAIRDAEKQRMNAYAQVPLVNSAVLRARGQARRTDAFIAQVEKSWRPKESR